MSEKRTRLLLSFRRPGHFWTISESGEGERMSLANTARPSAELMDLSDDDLDEIIELCKAMQNERRKDHL